MAKANGVREYYLNIRERLRNYIKYFPSVRWLSPVCRIRPLLSRLFSFMVSAPFLVGKSLDMTCVHHNTYKAHLH